MVPPRNESLWVYSSLPFHWSHPSVPPCLRRRRLPQRGLGGSFNLVAWSRTFIQPCQFATLDFWDSTIWQAGLSYDRVRCAPAKLFWSCRSFVREHLPRRGGMQWKYSGEVLAPIRGYDGPDVVLEAIYVISSLMSFCNVVRKAQTIFMHILLIAFNSLHRLKNYLQSHFLIMSPNYSKCE